MDNKTVLNMALKDSKIAKASLLAEYLDTIEKYLTIDETELMSIKWVDKKGNYISMLSEKEKDNFITKREQLLRDYKDPEKEYMEKNALELQYHARFKNLLSKLTSISPQKRSKIALELCSFSESPSYESISTMMQGMGDDEKREIIDFFTSKCINDLDTCISISHESEIIVDFLLMLVFIKTGVSYDSDVKKSLNKNLILRWFNLLEKPDEIKVILDMPIDDVHKSILNTMLDNISKLFHLSKRNRSIALLFIKEIIKMQETIPEMAESAIYTGNPFLFRSLFLDFKEAKEFAVGGKLNSSLETKYGSLFENLMLAFQNGRELRNGGIDVIVNRESFDIKSGPNVMNKSQVDAFSMKQRLIEHENFLPSTDSYKIALGYGKRDQLNSFMAKIDSEILVGREAWDKITGIPDSPEIVFAIAGLVAKIFNSDSIVASMLNQHIQYTTIEEDDNLFLEMFLKCFDPVELSPETQSEIKSINELI